MKTINQYQDLDCVYVHDNVALAPELAAYAVCSARTGTRPDSIEREKQAESRYLAECKAVLLAIYCGIRG